ncbi:hypothetical protein MMC12_003816 [Toensbergia leucococca]|nr:hypothetical protein [Toensbergia leucococca]
MPRLRSRKSSPTMSSFDAKQLLPISDTIILPPPKSPSSKSSPKANPHSPVSLVPQQGPALSRTRTEPLPAPSPTDDIRSYDLGAPLPNKRDFTLDGLSERLFSDEHLRVILHDPSLFLRFTAFLNRYKPHSAPVLVRYLETRKAIKAIEYANALSHAIQAPPGDHSWQVPCEAALIDARFEARSRRCFETLVNDALPAFITHNLVKVVTDCMVKEITGTIPPVMRELVGGLAEVFCLSDPKLKDNPIVYASEEFYRTTQYGRDYVIGRNCRFLQGPKTERQSIERLTSALHAGKEICETVLNYRRDGSPFMNLLMCAPLYDDRGSVRYFIGAQVDVSGLIENGHGLDSFEKLLTETREQQRQRNSDHSQESVSKRPLRALAELAELLSSEETSVLRPRSRSDSMQDDGSVMSGSMRTGHGRREIGSRPTRRILGNDDKEDEDDRNMWALSSLGPSGKLPGVYQNYLLIRPHPSLRIIFVSPALRIPGLLQSPFLTRIGGPASVRDGLASAFAAGHAVTAKVSWLPQGRGETTEHADAGNGSRAQARTRYISCTPLWGSDDRVGVWMVVMVEDERVTGGLVRGEGGKARPAGMEDDGRRLYADFSGAAKRKSEVGGGTLERVGSGDGDSYRGMSL